MAVQGHALNQEEINRIISLLQDTDMTMPEIAARMQCSRSAIVSINRRFRVREYLGLRSRWQNSTANRTWVQPSDLPRGTTNAILATVEQERVSNYAEKK